MRKCLLLLWSVLFLGSAKSQLCQGSLGDPIVNITFGSGTNPGPPLSAATTNYQFKSGDCPNDGLYTVINRTSNCFSSTWHSLNSDHTGDPNGYFMLVNASQQPSAFYIDTVNVLCSNTTYEFAAWVINMIRISTCPGGAIQPNLTFTIEKIDGTVLQTFNTGDVPQQPMPSWKQYGFFFSTPPDVSKIVLRITNNAPGGCGNDLALDDITFRACGPLLDASISGSAITNFCEGEATPQILSCNISAGYTNPYFQWQQSLDDGAIWKDIPGANQLTYAANLSPATRPGVYKYRLSVSKIENKNTPACRVNSNPLTIRVNAKPVVAITGNRVVCRGNTILLTASGGTNYLWTGANGLITTSATLSLPDAQALQTGKYFVEVSNDTGCKQNDSVLVIVNPKPTASVSPAEVFMCEGTSTTLNASGGESYQWKPAFFLSSSTISNPSVSPYDTTRYMVIAANSFSCTDTAYVQVNVSKKSVANAGPDKFILQGQTAQVSGSAEGSNISYNWSPILFLNDATSLQPIATPTEDMVYTLQVVSNDGCGTAIDSVKVSVFKNVYVPNAFSPNGDGLNDDWIIPALPAFANYEILVFDRYGQVVYQSKNMAPPWNGTFKGKSLPTGIYPYIISIQQMPVKLTGWVMLLR